MLLFISDHGIWLYWAHGLVVEKCQYIIETESSANIRVSNMGTAQIKYQKNIILRDEMMPQNITYSLDSSSDQHFNIK